MRTVFKTTGAHVKKDVRTTWMIVGLCLLVGVGSARAQETRPVGWEMGVDIYTGMRAGEAAFYVGGFGGNNLLALRASALDETNVIPCSVGIMYEYVAFRNKAARIKPAAGVSANRIFSCAMDADKIQRPSPPMHGSRVLSAGVRIPIFTTQRIGGSLKILGFSGRMFGQTKIADANTRGIVLGAVIHAK